MRLQSFFTDPIIHRSFKANNEMITSCIFTPDMKQVISGTEKGSIFVWNFKPQMRPFRFEGHKGLITDLAINPTGTLIASSSQDETVQLWNNTVAGKHRVLKCHPAPVRSVDFSNTGKYLLTASNDKTIKIFDLYPKTKFISSYKGHSNWVRCARFSPDNRLIGSCGDDNAVCIFDIEKKSKVFTFLDHLNNVNSCRFSPDGTIIASGGDDCNIKLFDIRSGRLIQHYDAHNDKINAISYHASGNYLISGSDDSTIKIWDLKMGQILYTVHGNKGKVKTVRFSKDGDYFCSGGQDSILMIWKSNIKNMDEEFQTLGQVRAQPYTMTNKSVINLEESKQSQDNKYIDKMKGLLDGGENVIKPAKIPNKAFGMRYKVTLEQGVKDIYGLDQAKSGQHVLQKGVDGEINEENSESQSHDDSSMMLNPAINPFSKLPTEMASAFDKMIHQLEIISQTMRVMDQRIMTVEGQVEELYGMRNMQSALNNEEMGEIKNKPNSDSQISHPIAPNEYAQAENYYENVVDGNNFQNPRPMESVEGNIGASNQNPLEIMNNNNNNNQDVQYNKVEIYEEEQIPPKQNNVEEYVENNVNVMTSNNGISSDGFAGTFTGMQASFGNMDLNANDVKNVFKQTEINVYQSKENEPKQVQIEYSENHIENENNQEGGEQ